MNTKRTGHPLLGILVICASGAAAFVLEGGHIAVLLQPSSWLFVTGGVVGAVLIGCGLTAPLAELWALVRGRPGDFVVLRRALRLVILTGPVSGFLGTLVGLIHIMANMSDPGRLGSGMAVAMTALFYGLTYALVGYGLDTLASRRAEASAGDDAPSQGASGLPLTGTMVVFAAFAGVHVLKGGDIPSLVNSPAVLLVVGGVLGALMMSTGVVGPAKQLAAVLFRGDVDDGQSLVDALRVVILAAPVAGFVGATVGTIDVLGNLQDPARLGAGVALAYLTMIYSATIAFFGYAVAALVASRDVGNVENLENLETSSLLHAPLYAVAGCTTGLAIMMTTLYSISATT